MVFDLSSAFAHKVTGDMNHETITAFWLGWGQAVCSQYSANQLSYKEAALSMTYAMAELKRSGHSPYDMRLINTQGCKKLIDLN